MHAKGGGRAHSQLPHCPWFLTGVSTPWSRQSSEGGHDVSLSDRERKGLDCRAVLGRVRPVALRVACRLRRWREAACHSMAPLCRAA